MNVWPYESFFCVRVWASFVLWPPPLLLWQTFTSSPPCRSCGRWPPSRWSAACRSTSSSTCADASLHPTTPSWRPNRWGSRAQTDGQASRRHVRVCRASWFWGVLWRDAALLLQRHWEFMSVGDEWTVFMNVFISDSVGVKPLKSLRIWNDGKNGKTLLCFEFNFLIRKLPKPVADL